MLTLFNLDYLEREIFFHVIFTCFTVNSNMMLEEIDYEGPRPHPILPPPKFLIDYEDPHTHPSPAPNLKV